MAMAIVLVGMRMLKTSIIKAELAGCGHGHCVGLIRVLKTLMIKAIHLQCCGHALWLA